jgi:transposase-like protein
MPSMTRVIQDAGYKWRKARVVLTSNDRPLLVATDGAPGLIRAAEECFPRSYRQRCLAHRRRNLQSTGTEAEWPELREHVKACYEAPSREMARALRQGVVDRYAKTFPAAVACLEDDFDACTARTCASRSRTAR